MVLSFIRTEELEESSRSAGITEVTRLEPALLMDRSVSLPLKIHFILSLFIIIISLTFIFFQDKSRVWTAASQQH